MEAPAHKQTNIPKLIGRCVTIINECAKRPSKFVKLMNKQYKYKYSISLLQLMASIGFDIT